MITRTSIFPAWSREANLIGDVGRLRRVCRFDEMLREEIPGQYLRYYYYFIPSYESRLVRVL